MTLGNMRANGVRSLAVSCWQCHHETMVSADRWPDACRAEAELFGTVVVIVGAPAAGTGPEAGMTDAE
jgi:hypothetical protein